MVSPEKLKDCAVYIKGTSSIKSAIRAAKRDGGMQDNTKDKVIVFSKTLAKKFYGMTYNTGNIDRWRKYYQTLQDKEEKSMKEASYSNEYIYRYTYDNEGIYEAFKKNVPSEVWKEFLNSKAANWLPKPDKYPKRYISYFTYDGKYKFEKHTLPIISKYLDKDKIELTKIDSSTYLRTHEPVYYDKYQVIVNESAHLDS